MRSGEYPPRAITAALLSRAVCKAHTQAGLRIVTDGLSVPPPTQIPATSEAQTSHRVLWVFCRLSSLFLTSLEPLLGLCQGSLWPSRHWLGLGHQLQVTSGALLASVLVGTTAFACHVPLLLAPFLANPLPWHTQQSGGVTRSKKAERKGGAKWKGLFFRAPGPPSRHSTLGTGCQGWWGLHLPLHWQAKGLFTMKSLLITATNCYDWLGSPASAPGHRGSSAEAFMLCVTETGESRGRCRWELLPVDLQIKQPQPKGSNLGVVTCVVLPKLMGTDRATELPSGRAFSFSWARMGAHGGYSPDLDAFVQCLQLCGMHLGLCCCCSQRCY